MPRTMSSPPRRATSRRPSRRSRPRRAEPLYVIPGRREAANPESITPVLPGDRIVEISPMRIGLFDRCNLPIAPPFLDFLFAGDGRRRIVITFKPNKKSDAIAGCKAGRGFSPMLIHAPHQVARDADVQRSMLLAKR